MRPQKAVTVYINYSVAIFYLSLNLDRGLAAISRSQCRYCLLGPPQESRVARHRAVTSTLNPTTTSESKSNGERRRCRYSECNASRFLICSSRFTGCTELDCYSEVIESMFIYLCVLITTEAGLGRGGL